MAPSGAAVAAGQLCSAGQFARRRRGAAAHWWINAPVPASTPKRIAGEDATGRAAAKVAEVLADVVAACERLSAHLQTEVGLVVLVVEAGAAHHVATVVPAGLLHLANLRAQKVRAFCTRNLTAGAAAAALPADLLFAWAARSLVAAAPATMLAALTCAPTPFAAQRKRVGAPLASPDTADKERGRGLAAAMVGPAASTAVAPRGWLPGALRAVPLVALPLACVLTASEPSPTRTAARVKLTTADALLLLRPTEAGARGCRHARRARPNVALHRASVAAAGQLPATNPATGPLRWVPALRCGAFLSAAVAAPRAANNSATGARSRVAEVRAAVGATPVTFAHVATAVGEPVWVLLRLE